jgi:anti-sigma factor RsiW
VSEHIDELAELYALGTLDERERAAVDAHALECDACAQRLGEAASTIAFMELSVTAPASLDRRMSAVFARSPRLRIPTAVAAAAFIIGLLPSFWFWSVARNAHAFDTDRQHAVQAMVTSHFAHAQFTPLESGAPKAKLIYARTGNWIFVVAETGRALSLRSRSGQGEVTLGTLHASGNAAELFVAQAPRARTFALFDGNREIERVTIPPR